ncbi:UDP-3-O-acyl-N-acetylglucosamine deacetylase [Candidatus Liberibacter africanus]|uniref:UDP-3-O-acyl-N-acetylglucosamine deacetylase n=1 Tax=Candidatus Liberibacter africanus PTSAPSY TaxID=1277257 RepID=A0A0G3I3R9_LIBAF|nr:UDP-3-O-acyl-N-acetylglucosamine deacetylase [Candidatus Liberibacter africanus]AKK20509.1 UDP-3-O-[3-hydroxymyristoyl] N-acetylglucosamine deacetylase [Candidatus Liberibacter africanus PTSAPSY]QTP64221.1 UDP-3-O-acyl-N-acetylglucosamine deacetylase [Candidatus Liberibacter africanus]
MLQSRSQHTIADSITITGIGVHSGKNSILRLCPAQEGVGILFRSIQSRMGNFSSSALWNNVLTTSLSTAIGSSLCQFHTIEHLMAALYAYGIDNVIVELDGIEIPIMDGSALAFVQSIDRVGVKKLKGKRRYLKIIKSVRVTNNESWAEFLPYPSTHFEISIQFNSNVIGYQKWEGDLTKEVFCNEICIARTFGFLKDVKRYRKAGCALGASLENSVVISEDDKVINTEGLRYSGQEFVRHKALDAIGDIALAGYPLIGCYRSYRGSHKINHIALSALFADKNAYEIVDDYIV